MIYTAIGLLRCKLNEDDEEKIEVGKLMIEFFKLAERTNLKGKAKIKFDLINETGERMTYERGTKAKRTTKKQKPINQLGI